MCEVYLSWLCN